jgi:hypothetical protein
MICDLKVIQFLTPVGLKSMLTRYSDMLGLSAKSKMFWFSKSYSALGHPCTNIIFFYYLHYRTENNADIQLHLQKISLLPVSTEENGDQCHVLP